jgi:tetratricopeptide (TPR) repeat protein
VQARDLFEKLSQDQKLALFNLSAPENVGDELVVVAEGVYQYMENTPEDNVLLKAMADILGQTGSSDAIKLTLEINDWIGGREAEGKKDHSLAISLYTRAFENSQDRKNENAAILIDRAFAYVMLSQYTKALVDYDNAVEIDSGRTIEVEKVVSSDQSFADYLRENLSSYPNLSNSITIPSVLPTKIPTSTTVSVSPTRTIVPTVAVEVPEKIVAFFTPNKLFRTFSAGASLVTYQDGSQVECYKVECKYKWVIAGQKYGFIYSSDITVPTSLPNTFWITLTVCLQDVCGTTKQLVTR